MNEADDTTLMAESEEELKNLLMRVKEQSTKNGLKLNIKKTKIMATGSITSWEIEGEDMEEATDFLGFMEHFLSPSVPLLSTSRMDQKTIWSPKSLSFLPRVSKSGVISSSPVQAMSLVPM